jgi:hypothetical protein
MSGVRNFIMKTHSVGSIGRWLARVALLLGLMLPLAASAALPSSVATGPESLIVIVQASDAITAAVLVRSAGGTVTYELGIINAVGARMTAAQVEAVIAQGARVYGNRTIQLSPPVRRNI